MSRALDTAEWAIHYLAHHDPTASCLKGCPICEEGTMTDADTEAGRGEGRSYDDMTSHLLAQRLEAIAMGEDRHEVDDPHVMLAAARRLRQSDPGGEKWSRRARNLLGALLEDIQGARPDSVVDCPCSRVAGRQDEIADLLTAAPTDEAPEGRTVGCEDEDGLLITHPDSETCEVCAPPVEEGDEAVNALMASLCRRLIGALWELPGFEHTPGNSIVGDVRDYADRLRAPDARQGEGDTDEVALRKMFHRAWREYHDMYGHDADEAMDAFCDWVREVLSEHLATLSEQL